MVGVLVFVGEGFGVVVVGEGFGLGFVEDDEELVVGDGALVVVDVDGEGFGVVVVGEGDVVEGDGEVVEPEDPELLDDDGVDGELEGVFVTAGPMATTRLMAIFVVFVDVSFRLSTAPSTYVTS